MVISKSRTGGLPHANAASLITTKMFLPQTFNFTQVKSVRAQMGPRVIAIWAEHATYSGTFSPVVLRRHAREPVILHMVSVPVSIHCLN